MVSGIFSFVSPGLTSLYFRLCDIRFTSVKANLNLDRVALNTQTGDFNPSSLVQQMNKEPINELVVKSWIDRAGESFSVSLVSFFSISTGSNDISRS